MSSTRVTHLLRGAAIIAALLGALLFPRAVLSATYVTTCPPDDASCLALAERLEAVVLELENHGATLTAIDANTSGSGPTTIAGTVALSPDDRDRLDLSWWGAWAAVGLLFVLILAPRWFAAFRTTHGA